MGQDFWPCWGPPSLDSGFEGFVTNLGPKRGKWGKPRPNSALVIGGHHVDTVGWPVVGSIGAVGRWVTWVSVAPPNRHATVAGLMVSTRKPPILRVRNPFLALVWARSKILGVVQGRIPENVTQAG